MWPNHGLSAVNVFVLSCLCCFREGSIAHRTSRKVLYICCPLCAEIIDCSSSMSVIYIFN